jgi:dienelactone hydrolase
MFKQDDEITPVIFRRWPKCEGGAVVAIFPTILGTYESHTMSCYQHVGQHGTCDLGIIHRTKLARETDADVMELRRELEGAPYGYRLKVYQRDNRTFHKAREAEAAHFRYMAQRAKVSP